MRINEENDFLKKIWQSRANNVKIFSNSVLESSEQLPKMTLSPRYVEGETLRDLSQVEQYKDVVTLISSHRQKNNSERKLGKIKQPQGIQQIWSQEEQNYFQSLNDQDEKEWFKNIRVLEPSLLNHVKEIQKNDISQKDLEQVWVQGEEDNDLINKKLNLIPPSLKESFFDKPLQSLDPYYHNFQNQDRYHELENIFIKPPSLYIRMIKESSSQNLTPRKHGLVSLLDSGRKKLNFKNLGIGNKQVRVLSKGLAGSEFKSLRSINVSGNSLCAEAVKEICNTCKDRLKYLIISHNPLGPEGALVITQGNLSLKTLDISYCQLRVSGSNILLNYMMRSTHIVSLDMSGNEMGDGCANFLGKFTRACVNANELQRYLRDNGLQSFSAKLIFRGLQFNSTLKVLDISHNSIGRKVQGQINAMDEICSALNNKNCEIIHLDLTWNSFDNVCMKKLQLALYDNHRLFGLHIQGGNAPFYVNTQGFIIEYKPQPNESIEPRSVINGSNFVDNIPFPYVIRHERDICWICDGWQEVSFRWSLRTSGEFMMEPMFVHLNYENWRPLLMDKQVIMKPKGINSNTNDKSSQKISNTKFSKLLNQLSTKNNKKEQSLVKQKFSSIQKDKLKQYADENNEEFFEVYKMCPPNINVYYFFSNPMRNIQTFAEDAPVVDSFKVKSNTTEILFQDGSVVERKNISYFNHLRTKPSIVCDDKEDYSSVIKSVPRDTERLFMLNKFSRVKRRGTIVTRPPPPIPTTIIREEEIKSQFEVDFALSRLPKMIRTEQDKQFFKLLLYRTYSGVRELFRLLSTQNFRILRTNYYYSIQYKTLQKLVQAIELPEDEVKLKQTDLDLDLISLKNNPELNIIYNPDKALLRFQFLEIFIRISQDKYIRSMMVKTLTDAYTLFLSRQPLFGKIIVSFDNPHLWREQRYLTKEVALLILIKGQFLMDLFKQTVSQMRRIQPNQALWMTVYDIFRFFKKVNLITDYLTENDLHIICSITLENQVKDYYNDKNCFIYYAEFLEILGRVAELISPSQIGEKYEEVSYEERATQPLQVKMETLITYLMQTVTIIDTLIEYKLMFYNEFKAIISLPVAGTPTGLICTAQPKELSNELTNSYILKQLEEALQISQKYGCLPVQTFMSFINSQQKPYISQKFWEVFKVPDDGTTFHYETYDNQNEESEEEDYEIDSD